MKERQGFLSFHKDLDYIERDLTDEQAGKLWKLLNRYSQTGEKVDIDDIVVRIYYNQMTDKMDSQIEHYDDVSNQRAEAGRKSGEARRRKKNDTDSNATSVNSVEQKEAKRTNVNSVEQKGTNTNKTNNTETYTYTETEEYTEDDTYQEKETETESYDDDDSYQDAPTQAKGDGSLSSQGEKKTIDFVKINQAYYNATGKSTTPVQIDVLATFAKTYGEEWTVDALKVMGEAGRSDLPYLGGILKNWKTNGRRDHRPPDSAKPTIFNNFKQRPSLTDEEQDEMFERSIWGNDDE